MRRLGNVHDHKRLAVVVRDFANVKTGAVWFTDDETKVEKLRQVVFPNGHLNKDVVGRSAQEIGKRAGIDIPSSAKIILTYSSARCGSRLFGGVTSPIFTNDFRLCPADARENTPLLPVK